jgi:transmembrane sensor
MAFFSSNGFLKLLNRYRNDESTPEEKEAMDTWYESLDDPDIDVARNQESKEKVWMRIMENTTPEVKAVQRTDKNFTRFLYYAAAAVVILVGGITGYLSLRSNAGFFGNGISQIAGSMLLENNTGKPSEITLPDGSRVVLEPRAKISYTEGFNKTTRTVVLEGDAFFSVVKNKYVPFIVQTQTIETKVLGTEFSIRKNTTTGKTEVEVIKGKVEVHVVEDKPRSKSDGNQKVYLTANLKATFEPGRQELVMGLIANPRIVEEEEVMHDEFVFNDSPLKVVIQRLERAYGVSIKTANNEILNCPITANLSNEPLSTQLDIVMTALNARFTVNQAGISISGGGCGTNVNRHPDF